MALKNLNRKLDLLKSNKVTGILGNSINDRDYSDEKSLRAYEDSFLLPDIRN